MGFEYRLKRTLESIAGQQLWVEALEDLDQTIDALFVELERTGNASLLEELCPYFGTLWPSARALAEAIAGEGERLRGRRVLELGCGLAVPAMIAAKLGAEVVATDFHPEVPAFLERNLALNGLEGRVQYHRVDWQADTSGLGLFERVIGSDVLYERQHAAGLARVAARHLAPGGEILIADPARPYLQEFADEMRRAGFAQRTEIRRMPIPGGGSKDIFLLRFSRG